MKLPFTLPFRRKNASLLQEAATALVGTREMPVVWVCKSDPELILQAIPREEALEHTRVTGVCATVPNTWGVFTAETKDFSSSEASAVPAGAPPENDAEPDILRLWNKVGGLNQTDQNSIGFILSETPATSEVPRTVLSLTANEIEGFRTTSDNALLRVETKTRALFRAAFTYLDPELSYKTAALLVADKHGYALAFWNPLRGVIYEAEFVGPGGSDSEELIYQAVSELKKHCHPKTLADLNITLPENILFCGESAELLRFLKDGLEEVFVDESDYEGGVRQLTATTPEGAVDDWNALLALGLAAKTDIVPVLDLNRDLGSTIRALQEQNEHAFNKFKLSQLRLNWTLLFAPPIAVLICAVIYYATLQYKASLLEQRKTAAAAKINELEPVQKEIQQVKQISDQLTTRTKNINTLHQRQSISYSTFAELNGLFPPGSWKIDEMSALPTGAVTVKGRTMDETLIPAFINRLQGNGKYQSILVNSSNASGGASNLVNLTGPRGFTVQAINPDLAKLQIAPISAVPPPAAPNAPPVSGTPPPPAGQGTTPPAVNPTPVPVK